MIDILIHIPNYEELINELKIKAPELLNEDQGVWIYTWCPSVINNGEVLTLVRVEAEFLNIAEQLGSAVALGTYDDVFGDPDLREIYDRVYDQTPTTWTDEEGVEHTVNKPEKFGVFA